MEYLPIFNPDKTFKAKQQKSPVTWHPCATLSAIWFVKAAVGWKGSLWIVLHHSNCTHGNIVIRIMCESSNNAKHASRHIIQSLSKASVSTKWQGSDHIWVAPSQVIDKTFFFFFAFCDVCVLYDRNMALHHHKFFLHTAPCTLAFVTLQIFFTQHSIEITVNNSHTSWEVQK